MAFGIKLIQGGVTLAAGTAVHPAPITVAVGVVCYLSFTGPTGTYEWALPVRATGSVTVISSESSPGPTLVTDIDGGAYSITFTDDTATVYTLDLVTPTAQVVVGANGIVTYVTTIASLRVAGAGTASSATIYVACYATIGDGGGDTFNYDVNDTTSTDNSGTTILCGTRRYKRNQAGGSTDLTLLWFGPTTANVATAINLAIQALPSGSSGGGRIDLGGLSGAYTVGTKITVDRPVEIVPSKGASFVATASRCLELQANFRMVGNDRSMSWTSASNGTLFYVTGAFPGTTAEPNIEIRNMKLAGNGASSKCLDTSTATFNEGRILFDNNKIGGFGTGLEFSTSVYYNTIVKNYFVANGTSIIVGDAANTQIFQNQLLGGTGDQIVIRGFGTKIVNNEFLGSSSYPNAADILFEPVADASQGGFAQVHGNNFFGENESCNPNRARIKVSYPTHPGYSSPPVEVTGNLLFGMAQKAITAATVNGSSLVTFTVASGHGIPSGETANVHVFNCDNPTYDGKFTVTATSATQFTVTCTRTSGVFVSGLLVNGDTTAAFKFLNPPLKWLIDDNQCGNFGTIIDDAYTSVPAVSVQGSGKSVFGAGNRISTGPFSFAPQLFSGSGKGFERVSPPAGLNVRQLDANPAYAPTKIENQILQSESWANAAWVVSAGVTKTAGQTDPFGGTAAVLIDSTGTGGSKSIAQIYTASAATQIVEFWGKAAAESDGSCNSSLLVGILDNTSGVFQEGTDRIRLGTSWKKYRMCFTGLTVGHSNQIDFRAAGNSEIPGHFYLAFPQSSDVPSDYVTTTGAAVSTQTFARIKHPKQAVTGNLADETTGGALKSLLTALSTTGLLTDSSGTTKPTVSGAVTDLTPTGALTSLLATLATAGVITNSSTAMGTPTISSSTGFGGAGAAVAMDAGSTDHAGSITITVGAAPGASGTIVVAFGTAYTFALAPVVLVQLSKSNTEWPVGTEPLQVKDLGDSGFTIVWRSTVVATQVFSIQFLVAGR